MWHTKMHFSAKCNSGRIAIQWFHIKHYLDYQYTKFQPYTFRVQKMCVFARYATLVPRLFLGKSRPESALSVCELGTFYHIECQKQVVVRMYVEILHERVDFLTNRSITMA